MTKSIRELAEEELKVRRDCARRELAAIERALHELQEGKVAGRTTKASTPSWMRSP